MTDKALSFLHHQSSARQSVLLSPQTDLVQGVRTDIAGYSFQQTAVEVRERLFWQEIFPVFEEILIEIFVYSCDISFTR